MTLKRILLTAATLLAASLIGISTYQSVSAAGESWYWNGTDTIQVSGGFFSSGLTLNSSNNNDSTKPEFAISEAAVNSGGASRFRACIGIPDSSAIDDVNENGECKRSADPGAVDRCRAKSDGDCANVFIIECRITKLEVRVDKANNSVSEKKLEVSSDVIADNVHTYQGKLFNNQKCADGLSFGQIKNQPGDSAANTTLEEGLEREKQRLSEEYIKQQCGDNPSPDCAAEARAAFEVIFQACLANADHINVSDEDSASLKINSVRICIEQKTGLKLDTTELERGLLTVADYEEEKPSCAIEWIGWVVCPVTRFMGKLADTGFDALEKLLIIQPMERGTKGGDSLFVAWSLMRNVANVLFVVAFMVIIYSQLTGFGLDNYGIKKLLPRIIIAALLVNSSFYIALIMVDLSNILGSSLYHLLRGYADNLQLTITFADFSWEKLIQGFIGVSAAGIAVVGAALYGSLSALVPMLTTVVLALLTAVMLLVGRYALIVVLVIVAPVAFVAYLLPNTQKWFSMWYKTFLSLLMLYPIMGLVYGASYLAGIIVMNSAGSGAGNGIKDDMLQLFGMSITAIPLLLTPLIMKFGGGVLNRWGGSIQNNGLFKKANSRANQFSERRKNARDLRGLQRFGDNKRSGLAGLRDKAIQRRFKKEAIRGVRGGQLSKATSTHISAYMSGEEGSGGDKTSLLERAKAKTGAKDLNGNEYQPKTKAEQYAGSLAKGGDENALNRAMSQAVNAKLSVHNEEVATAKEMLTNNFEENDWKRIAAGLDAEHNSTAVRQAAIEKVAALQDNGIDEIVKSVSTMDGQLRYALARSIQQNNSNVIYNNPTALKTIMNGGVTVTGSDGQPELQPLNAGSFHQQIVATSIAEGHMTSQDLASAEHETIADIQTAINQGHVSSDDAIRVSSQAQHALNNKYTREQATDKTRAQLEQLSYQGPVRPPDNQ